MYHIIVNSTRLKGKNSGDLDIVKDVFDRAGKQYEIHYTEYAGHAAKIAAQLTADEQKVRIIAMGGDGTLHEVLNGIKDPSKCKLGVIPIGSGNDFAAAIGLPENNVKYAARSLPSALPYSLTTFSFRRACARSTPSGAAWMLTFSSAHTPPTTRARASTL